MTIEPGQVARGLWRVTWWLTLASLLGQVAKYFLGHDVGMGLIAAFNLNAEINIPAWFSSSMLMLTAVLLVLIATDAWHGRRPFAGHWSGLAILFVLLSLDETVSIHEQWAVPLRTMFNATGLFYYPWVILAIGAFAMLAFVYRKFFRDMPDTTRHWLLRATIVYVGGAVGMEMLAGLYVSRIGTEHTFAYVLMTTVEEFMEMTGIVIFMYGLLGHLGRHASVIRIGGGGS